MFMKKYMVLALGLALGLSSCDKTNKDPKVINPAEKVFNLDNFKFDRPTNEVELKGIMDALSGSDFTKAETSAQADLKSFKDAAEAIDKEVKAVKGTAGYLEDNSKDKMKKRLVNANGVEIEQAFKKGMIGAFQLYGLNKSIDEVLKASDEKVRKEALNKAIVYLLGDLSFTKTRDEYSKAGNSFGKYLISVAGLEAPLFKGIDKKLYTAMAKAYLNISDLDKVKTYLAEINKYANLVVASRGVHYIFGYTQKLREKGATDGHIIHELSEGLGFIYSLQFASKFPKEGTYMTKEHALEFTSVNLWDEATDKTGKSVLDKGSIEVAQMFGFEPADA